MVQQRYANTCLWIALAYQVRDLLPLPKERLAWAIALWVKILHKISDKKCTKKEFIFFWKRIDFLCGEINFFLDRLNGFNSGQPMDGDFESFWFRLSEVLFPLMIFLGDIEGDLPVVLYPRKESFFLDLLGVFFKRKDAKYLVDRMPYSQKDQFYLLLNIFKNECLPQGGGSCGLQSLGFQKSALSAMVPKAQDRVLEDLAALLSQNGGVRIMNQHAAWVKTYRKGALWQWAVHDPLHGDHQLLDPYEVHELMLRKDSIWLVFHQEFVHEGPHPCHADPSLLSGVKRS
jgi:hypothetical protein